MQMKKTASRIKRVLIIFWLWKLKKWKKHEQNFDALFSVRTIGFCILMPSSAFLKTSFCVFSLYIIIYHQSLPHKKQWLYNMNTIHGKKQQKLLLSKDFQLILFVLHIEFIRSI